MVVASTQTRSPSCRQRGRLSHDDAQYDCLARVGRRYSWQEGHWHRSILEKKHAGDIRNSSISTTSEPEDSGASFFWRGSEAIESGRCHEGISLLLQAQRIAAEAAMKMRSGGVSSKMLSHRDGQCLAEAAAAVVKQTYERQPSLFPAKVKREGSLLLFEPQGPGQRYPPAFAHGRSRDNVSFDISAHAGKKSQTEGDTWRYEAWLCGGEVPRVDCANDEGFQKALDFVARREPVVMTNLNVMPRVSKWSFNYLQKHTTEWPGMTVLTSPGNDNRYLYYVPEQADRDMSAFKGAPRYASENKRMSFNGFLSGAKENPEMRYYLQEALVVRDIDDRGKIREHWCAGIDERLRSDCDGELDRERLEKLQAFGKFGHWARTQLFVGPNDTLSPVHYDQYDNIFLQVSGSKHLLLFDPRAAEGLYPFPLSHPYDEYAMVDLANVDHKAFPAARDCLACRGASVTLMPGESIYIPTHWWHHVQGVAAEASWSISINFWFAIFRDICQPAHPLYLHLELELARHAELLISDNFGSTVVGAISEALVADVDSGCESSKDFVSLALRNFILFRLARLLGAESVRSFIKSNFARERFDRASVQRALQGPRRGSRERLQDC